LCAAALLNKPNAKVAFLLHLKQIAKTAASGISAFKPVLEPAGKVLNVPAKNLQNGDKLRQGGAVRRSNYVFCTITTAFAHCSFRNPFDARRSGIFR